MLASPSDVQAERDVAGSVIDAINLQLRDAGLPAYLELGRWETDASPGYTFSGRKG